jgi:Domain of unknown function (DUF4132)
MTASTTATAVPDASSWVRATDQHELAIDLTKGALVCRNTKGRLLKSVPKRVRDSAAADRLRALLDWLARHEAECRATVERWMLASTPVPAAVLAAVWSDPAWRRPIEHTVVASAGDDGSPSKDGSLGFLRGVGEDGRLGIVDLDGETRWLDDATVTIPHPVLLDDLDELRGFAVELGVEQGIQQLLREVHRKPADLDAAAERLEEFAGAHFVELRHALARAGGFGFQVRGGYAVCQAFDDGVPVEARYWLGADDPLWEAWTGELVWVDRRERHLTLGQVGPVAWSEGVRMASLIHAGRVAEQAEG